MKYVLIVSTLLFLTSCNQLSFWPPPLDGKVLTAEEKKICGITAEVTEGPYYVSGMPQVKEGDINFTHISGKSVSVSGVVYEGLDTTKPLKNAIVEVWHADPEGNYHPNSNGVSTKYSSYKLALRGYVITDDMGKYTFSTVYPWEYSWRTTHIHIKIRAEWFSETTTQLILPAADGKDNISFDEDTVSQGLPNCHLLKPNEVNGVNIANFDFHISNIK